MSNENDFPDVDTTVTAEQEAPRRGGTRNPGVLREIGDVPLPAERRTRRSRLGGSGDDFETKQWWKPGWSYQWHVVTVHGKEVDPSEFVRIADGGWEPVRPNEMPNAVPAGYRGNTIDRMGQRLYRRPEYLTQEALAEDLQIARQQKDAKLAQAYGTGQGEARREVQTMDIQVKPPGG